MRAARRGPHRQDREVPAAQLSAVTTDQSRWASRPQAPRRAR